MGGTIRANLWLLFCVAAGYALLLTGTQFLHDDSSVILYNLDLWNVQSLKDCFTFTLQVTKPVTNFFFALINWLSHFSVTGNRLSSIALHALTVLAWYAILCRLAARVKALPHGWPLAGASLFALAPLHAETLGVAQFRGEVLATLFTLLAWLCAPFVVGRFAKWALAGVLLFIGLAALSKEAFYLTALRLVAFEWAWIFAENKSKQARRHAFNSVFALAIFSIVLWVGLYRLYCLDSSGPYTYAGNIGMRIFAPADWITYAGRALVEGLRKALTGTDLTTVRLLHREGWGAGWPFWLHGICVAGFLGGMLALGRRVAPALRPLVFAFVCPLSIYLLVPNQNVGSEHYWYFSLAPGYALLLWAFSLRLQPRRFSFAAGAVGIFFLISLQNRLLDFHDRVTLYRAEVRTYPTSNWAALNLAIAEAEAGVELTNATVTPPPGVPLPLIQLGTALDRRDLPAVERLLNDAYRAGFRGRGLSTLFSRASFLLYSSGDPVKALAAARTALMLYPANQAAERMVMRLEKAFYQHPPMAHFLQPVEGAQP